MFSFRVLSILSVYFSVSEGIRITDKEYALMPELFHLDDYDRCMLHGKEALYCSITYEFEPINRKDPSNIWKIVEKISSDPSKYRHDKLRHGVCVTTTCANMTTNNGNKNDQLTECYNAKYAMMGLHGKITEMHCETTDPVYEVDNLDKTVAVIFIIYVALVVYATFYEGIARYKPQKEYDKIVGTKFGRLMAGLSICRNWYRLKTVKETQDTNSLRAIQGIRFYNMIIVIFCHTVMISFTGGVSNTQYIESIRGKFGTLFLNNGGYAVQTFFMISGWLLTYHLFLHFDNKREIKLSHIVLAFVHRYLRLTPALLAVLAFHSTWFRHLSRGPVWDEMVGEAFRRCRKNWWSNLLYLNNYIDPYHMCMPHTWYLGVDTQLFVLELIIVYIMLKNKKYIPLILTTIVTLSVVILAAVIYAHDYDPVIWPNPEYMYRFRVIESLEWHVILGSAYSNFAGLVTGICYGYAFYLYKGKKMFTSTLSVFMWWLICLLFPLGIIIIPGLWIYSEDFEHNIWFSVLYIGLGRLIFTVGIGFVIFGMSKGVGWIAKWICEWPPTYILGRLSYSSYLIHVSLVVSRGAMRRSNIFIADYIMFCEMLGDIGVGLIGAVLLTLFVEMPGSEFLKMILPAKNEGNSHRGSENGRIQDKSKVA